MRLIYYILFITIFSSCWNENKTHDSGELHGKIGTYKELKKELKDKQGDTNSFPPVVANISELESEINNGGFNQYFFNSSGQNCFETQRYLETKKDKYHMQLARLLKQTIETINVNNLPEKELIKKIRRRELESLENDSINNILDSLDQVYYGN